MTSAVCFTCKNDYFEHRKWCSKASFYRKNAVKDLPHSSCRKTLCYIPFCVRNNHFCMSFQQGHCGSSQLWFVKEFHCMLSVIIASRSFITYLPFHEFSQITIGGQTTHTHTHTHTHARTHTYTHYLLPKCYISTNRIITIWQTANGVEAHQCLSPIVTNSTDITMYRNKKAVLSQGNRAMPQVLFLV